MIRGTTNEIKKEVSMNLHNRFDVEVVDAKTGKVKTKAVGYNVICNALWSRLLAPNSYFNYIHYGSGSGTPAATDTSLFAFSGYGTPGTTDEVFNHRKGMFSLRRMIRLSPETAVGVMLTEVGIAYGTGASTLCTHSMLQDMNGNPISIAKTDTDIINIYATVFVHWDATDDNIQISDRSRRYGSYTYGFMSYLAGMYYATRSDTWFHVYLAQCNSANSGYPNRLQVHPVYSAQNKKLAFSGRFNVTAYNHPNMLALAAFSYEHYTQLYFHVVDAGWFPGSWITHEAVGTGDGVKTDFKTAFSMISEATIYVNGEETTATIDAGYPFVNTAYALGIPFMLCSYNGEDGTYLAGRESDGNIETYQNEYYTSKNGRYSIGEKTRYLLNPFYEKVGITSFSTNGIESISVSNDGFTYVEIITKSTGWSVPIEHQHCKYWKVTAMDSSPDSRYVYIIPVTTRLSDDNIHFATPPAEGAVITADYFSRTIAKDENHVFDFTFEIQLGEYVE